MTRKGERKRFSGLYILLRANTRAEFEAFLPAALVESAMLAAPTLKNLEVRALHAEWEIAFADGQVVIAYIPPGGMDSEDIENVQARLKGVDLGYAPRPWYDDDLSIATVQNILARKRSQ